MTENWIDRLTATPDGRRELQRERLILEVTELICSVMDEQGITRSELAGKLGRSKGYITQLLDGRANMTLRTISDVMWSMDRGLCVSAQPLSGRLHPPAHEQTWYVLPSAWVLHHEASAAVPPQHQAVSRTDRQEALSERMAS